MGNMCSAGRITDVRSTDGTPRAVGSVGRPPEVQAKPRTDRDMILNSMPSVHFRGCPGTDFPTFPPLRQENVVNTTDLVAFLLMIREIGP